MEEKKKARKIMVRAAMWAGAALILLWVFRRAPLDRMIADLALINVPLFLAVIVGFSALTLALDSVTHYWLFNRFNPPLGFLDTLRCRGETYLLLSLGFLYGQGGMAYAVSRRTAKPITEVTGSVFFLMLNTLISLMVFPTLTLLFFLSATAAPEFRASREWSIVARWLMISWPLIILHFVFWAKRWDNPLRRRLVGGLAGAFDQAGARDYAIALGLRFLQTLCWCAFTWLGLRAAQVHISLFDLMALGPLIGLISAVPTPGRLGPGQAAWLLLFQHKADPAALAAFSIIWVMSINIMRWIIGAVFLALPGAARIKKSPPSSDSGANEKPP